MINKQSGEGCYKVGPDSLDEWDFNKLNDDVKWLVYYYTSGSYDGSGYAVWQNENGTFGSTSLGHCSCYGPLEDANQAIQMSYNDMLDDVNGQWDKEIVQPVMNKVLELIKEDLTSVVV